MLDKGMYDSWKSIMEVYMQNREHRRMILESVKQGPLIWPTIEKNGVTRTKKYVELSAAEKIQAGCNGFSNSCSFLKGHNATSSEETRTILVIRVMLLVLGEAIQVDKQGLLNATTVKTEDLDTYDSNCDGVSNAKQFSWPIFPTMVLTLSQSAHVNKTTSFFYDNAQKQALGYQNSFYLKKAQRLRPTLYDGIVISDKHVAMPVIDDEETLILEEESRSKMSKKENDQEAIKQKISHKPIDYVKLNQLSKDFGKCFVPQQELLAE
nr:hypothetical protein [Tanacetum cinerariifolium]GEY94601.1 hypothetical protein [Tanacetum cinerariifolium]